ncbi:MAG: IS30 family transposase [Parcubacteria group bacterium]|nr:IS30 family transposase [Parcubacteria group bacterium]
MCIQHKDFAHLTQEDRFRIETLFGENHTYREIARITGIDISVISREFARNKEDDGSYCAVKAQKKTDERHRKSKYGSRKIENDSTLAETIETSLRDPLSYRQTVTYDRGSEFAWWDETEKGLTGTKIYFAHPHRPWERGTNERTNGLIRRYFPKGQKFATLTNDDVAKVVWRLNHRPRKILRWRTPCEVFERCCSSG